MCASVDKIRSLPKILIFSPKSPIFNPSMINVHTPEICAQGEFILHWKGLSVEEDASAKK